MNNSLMIETFAEKQVNDVRVGEGCPLIMIHGLAASLHDWDDLIPAATEAGYASYAFDLLGHGDSYKPKDIREYNIEKVYDHMVDWIESLDLDEPPVLIAHSLGCYLALLHTLRAPEQVRALVLTNPFYDMHQLSPTMQIISRHQLLNTRLIESTPYWMFRALVDLSSLKFNLGGGASHSYLLSEDIRSQTALDYKRADAGIFNLPRTLSNLFPYLSEIGKQALVIWGRHDRTLDPPSFSKLVEQLPNAHGTTIENCGHVPHQCHADEYNQLVLRFLNDAVC